MKGAILRTAAATLVLAAAAACTPVRTTHGFINDAEEPAAVQVGVDTKASVLSRLGSPSTTAVFDESSWYYISSSQRRLAFYNPRTVDRQVLVVRFNEDDTVAAVDRYGIERGQIVAYNNDATPTRGRELGLLEQIFGNVGTRPPILNEEDEQGPGQRRRN